MKGGNNILVSQLVVLLLRSRYISGVPPKELLCGQRSPQASALQSLAGWSWCSRDLRGISPGRTIAKGLVQCPAFGAAEQWNERPWRKYTAVRSSDLVLAQVLLSLAEPAPGVCQGALY